jgi:flagellar hook-associated protein 2
MGITVGGLISGMDTDSVISQLVQLQKRPITQLQQKQTAYQVKISAYATLQGSLKTLRTAAKNLDGLSDITNFSASSSNTSLLTVDAASTAAAGNHTITVNSLASAHQLTSKSGFTGAVGKGAIHLSIGSTTADIDVSDTSTISDIADAINAEDMGIYAATIYDGNKSYLTLTGKETGADNVIKLTVTEDGTSDPKLASNLDSTGLSSLVYTDTATSYQGETGGSGVASGLTINGMTVSDSVDMATLIDNINQDVSGVTATLQTDGSLLLSNSTGDDLIIGGTTTNTGLTVGTYSGTGSSKFTSVDAADADISVDGVTNILRSTNTIDDVIKGITLNLKSADMAKPVTASVARSDDLFTTRINAFLDAYNGLMDSLNNLQSYDSKTKVTGMLFGDSTTRRMQSDVRSLFSNSVSGLSSGLNRLVDFGVSTDEDGKAVLDSTVFKAKLKDNFEDVANFFTQTSTGFATRMVSSVDKMLDTSTGMLAVRTKGLEGSIDGMDDQIARLNTRLTRSETRLRTQFTALETILGKYQTLSDSVTAGLEQIQNSWGTGK